MNITDWLVSTVYACCASVHVVLLSPFGLA